MAWTQVSNKSRAGNAPRKWQTVPCVGIGKSGITFSVPMMELFDIHIGDHVNILIDQDSMKIGIKKADEKGTPGSYKVGQKNFPSSHKTKSNGHPKPVYTGVNTKVNSYFPDLRGYFKVRLENDRVIVAQLTDSNRVKDTD